MAFTDRRDAGRRLAGELDRRRLSTAVVIALPRGGVPVAAAVAARLGAPLDVLVVRKLGCPWQPELGFGAIGQFYSDFRQTSDEEVSALLAAHAHGSTRPSADADASARP